MGYRRTNPGAVWAGYSRSMSRLPPRVRLAAEVLAIVRGRHPSQVCPSRDGARTRAELWRQAERLAIVAGVPAEEAEAVVVGTIDGIHHLAPGLEVTL